MYNKTSDRTRVVSHLSGLYIYHRITYDLLFVLNFNIKVSSMSRGFNSCYGVYLTVAS